MSRDQLRQLKELQKENERLRDELLNGEIFDTLAEAMIIGES